MIYEGHELAVYEGEFHASKILKKGVKSMRKENNGIRYFSFGELPGVLKNKPKKDKRPEEQKERSREKFAGHCRVCGGVLSYVEGTNVMVCKNPDCKGIVKKSKKKDEEGEGTVNEVLPVFRTLDDKGIEIAMELFAG